MAGSGVRGETVDRLLVLETGQDPEEEGMVTRNSGDFRMKDQFGVFNPRTNGVGLLIFKEDGGLVYDSNGHPQLKVSE